VVEVDLYSEAKARQQEWLQEADAQRLLKSARDGARGRAGLRRHFMSWLGDRMVESGKRLQNQNR
jgi:hypothetical protein